MTHKIAMVQMLVLPGKPDENLVRAERMIGRAAELGAVCAVLPECCDIGWAHPSAAGLAEPIPGARSSFFEKLAKRHGIFILAGLTERCGAAVFNTAAFISPERGLIGKHRKINLLTDVEDTVYSVGDTLRVYDTPFGRVGINICADNLMPSIALGHSLGRMGARAILSPSSWAVPPEKAAARAPYGGEWLEPYRELASCYGMWVAGVSNVGDVTDGAWAGWKCIGSSIAVAPDGSALVLPYGERAEAVETFDFAPAPPKYSGTALSERIFKAISD